MMNQSENVKMIIIQRQIKWENYEVRQSPLSWLRQNLQKVCNTLLWLRHRYNRLQAVALMIDLKEKPFFLDPEEIMNLLLVW